MQKPNVVFVFADQWRAQATGYAGDPNVKTPVLDSLAGESVNFVNACSGNSVCCPYRASLMTGQYPLTHGVFVNDVELKDTPTSIADAFTAGGYDTGYIGKWHLFGSPDGHYGRRRAFVPRYNRQGFDYWKAFECNHNYNKSPYFEGDDETEKLWDGYDGPAQTQDACDYIRAHADSEKPFLLMLSWGTPHAPYDTAPEEYQAMYRDQDIELRPNVPPEFADQARETLRGYYAHMTALDDCMKTLVETLDSAGVRDNTIFIFTSDHGDMHGCQGLMKKGNPWNESIMVPFLLQYPALLGREGSELPIPIDAPDIMPTLLGLCGLPVPESVEGRDFSPEIRGERAPDPDTAALLNIPLRFGQMRRVGLPEYRGLRTARYTYVRSCVGPWLLYDNETDPYQKDNLCGNPEYAELEAKLERQLQSRLQELGDEFLPGQVYCERFGMGHIREVNCPQQDYANPWDSIARDLDRHVPAGE